MGKVIGSYRLYYLVIVSLDPNFCKIASVMVKIRFSTGVAF